MNVSSRKDDGGAPTLKIGDFSKLSSPAAHLRSPHAPRLTVGAL